MYYALTSDGYFAHDIPQEETPDPIEYHDWTAEPPPQPMYNPRIVGTRYEATGEWFGTWEDQEPPLAAEPLPEPAPDPFANPTISEWNALCEAAGIPGLCK